jgi:cholest-4-en-3-one 26-monooxygenase
LDLLRVASWAPFAVLIVGMEDMSNLGVFDPDLYANGDPWKAGLPLELFAELRHDRPCFWQTLQDEPLFIDGVWVISRYVDVVAVLRDTTRFSNRAGTSVRRFDPTVAERGGKPTMVSMDGLQHRTNRTVTSRQFSLRAVNTFADKFRTIAGGLITGALDKGNVDFITEVACYMPLHAVSEILGIPPGEREQVLAWTNTMTVPLDPHFTPTVRDFEAALAGLWDYGLALAKRRIEDPDETVMTAVAKGLADGRLTEDEVSGYMLQLAAAGNETTRNAIAFGLHALLLRPDQMALIRARGTPLTESAIEEILRWSAPTIHTVRIALEDVTLHGQRIRTGDCVALMLGSANFDSEHFQRPDNFNVERWPNNHIAFGTAAHTCLGLHVARLELRILFEELLRLAPHIRLDGHVEFVRDNLIHGIRKLPIVMGRGVAA